MPIGRRRLCRFGHALRSRTRRRLTAIELASRPPPTEADRLEAELVLARIASLRAVTAAAVTADSDDSAPAE